MGFSFHGHKRDVDAEKHLRRMHKTTPIIESPLVGADQDTLCFSQRHEANTIELFFDLFFVANLATFTAYHSITDVSYLLAYVGFFGILWSTWFQITLHDVRFARDSLYERVCKTIQFISFVGLALVGSKFNPGSAKGDNTNFQILCFVLVLTRALLAVQYAVVLFYTTKARYTKLIIPLGIMVGIYTICACSFGAMTFAFTGTKKEKLVYLVWYITMAVEVVVVIAVSCFWRMLSFKKTHLMERMSLLTIIVIGEGAIGVTKTVGKLMGKHGLDVEGSFLIMCIVVILVLIYALYFDNFPHGHYGTIRQQVWSCLHFPLHLAIVGVVEGSQQVALARYVSKNHIKILTTVGGACVTQNLDGTKLRDTLLKLVDYYELDTKVDTYAYYETVIDTVYSAGNTTGICAADAVKTQYPVEMSDIEDLLTNGLFTGLGMKLPVDKLKNLTPIQIAHDSWGTVYMYYWACFIVMMLCFISFLVLIRRHKADLFDFVSIPFRALVVGAGVAMLCLKAAPERMYNVMSSPTILPICVVLLFLTTVCDKITSVWCNHQLKKSGQPFALEFHEEHHGGHEEHHEGGEHGHAQMVNHSHNASDVDLQKTAHWSAHSDAEAGHGIHAAHGNMTPPLPTGEKAHGGYMPVSTGP
ncbi:hypothetical protein P153DRAFT_365692 [Dothidotthia symphoricarpi CBS 119687]|uniref:Low temperature requirement A n=1 Tax=Dothidotthia symphoricarpi CBS 119687 TaxID=1392245 RepID=A0A6A6AGN6_9PLEO|nr:uncharacterized protein P153DRAFT_365692 [Dothidotthia symphoricarpi CBS 119687]KAF2131089.1 hypothetical protein P153DRAFT_365692 [Dothidotthia symphoricarpi CBS 119687]